MRQLRLTAVLSLLILYGGGISDHDLWTPDEPRVAAVGKSVSRGAWVAPTLNGTPFLEQPPLHAWCVGLYYGLFGTTPEQGPRWLSALFGVGGLVFTGLLARRLAGPGRGNSLTLTTVVCLGVALEYCVTAHRVVVDGALTFFTTGAACFLLSSMESTRSAARWLSMTLAMIFASLAFLTKGAIGLAIPVLFGIVTMLRSSTHRRVLLPAVCLGPLVLTAVAGPWLWLLHERLGAEAFRTLFVDNTLGRVLDTSAGRSHVRPIYYYLLHFPVHFLPTTLALPGVLLVRWRSPGRFTERERFACDVALLWLGAGLLMLSLASTKRAVYLVPLFPAGAIACGLWVDRLIRARGNDPETETERRDRYTRIFPYLLCTLLLALGAAAPVTTIWLDGVSIGASAVVTVCAAVFAVAMLLMPRGRLDVALSCWLAGLALTFAAALVTLVPACDHLKSLGPITREVARTVPPGEPVFLYDPDETTEGLLPLYADRNGEVLRTPKELEQALLGRRRAFVLAIDKTYRRTQRRLEALLPFRPQILIEDARPHSRAIRLLLIEGAAIEGEEAQAGGVR